MNKLQEVLLFVRVQQLRDICKQLNLPFSGVKNTLIQRIVHFLDTGEIAEEKKFPEISKAKKGSSYPLHPETLILHGNYKNDAATRAFMKTLVGNHFHFTALGIDWIKDRWNAGNPPSYREFADFWQQQYQANKQKKPPPKKEWAYIRFTQNYLSKKPTASHKEIIAAWKEKQEQQFQRAQEMIQDCLSK